MTSSLKSDEDPVSERKKLYISERQIPALFEVDIEKLYLKNIDLKMNFQALMAGLMNNEPDDHYDFIIESLTKVC